MEKITQYLIQSTVQGNEVRAWEEDIMLPTYEIGKEEKNPIFLEKRVYQGSCGSVYPYPVVEKISDKKADKRYHALFIENEYIKVMILPELGGRIHMAYDKVKKRHFVYYNQVVKPALVGLTGPWISGGIEFNWPQHHRPSTFLPTDFLIEENADGSKTIWCNEVERMFRTKGMQGFTLYPGKAYIEIKVKIYNRTSFPQTFLWWANPAVVVNDHYHSVFPPDVNAVFDHGKRDVSSFPIATGVYYKQDYSAGVDISKYKNIPVPTSYMAIKSKYDFVGGYEEDVRGGLLHVADHHVSPGKKQWTWGNGDFGKAWDRNLTDEDGPYIELMTGMYTDNQPDFTWLQPYEEKSWVQYFMPYSEVGYVKNATKAALSAATNIAGGIISMITGIQALAVTGAEAIKGVERASVILSIVGTAVSLITSLFGLSSKAEKEHQEALKEVAENKLEMQRQYNLLLMEQNLLLEEATSIFGTDQIEKAINAIEVYRDAIAEYKEVLKGDKPTYQFQFNPKGNWGLDEYNAKLNAYNQGIGALNDITIKTGSYTTGAWFWKKQHDIYTSVLQVYPDLIDGEKNLNKERAQAILDTQTMSDENRNLLQNLIDLQEQAEEAQQALRDYLEGTFGSLGDSIMDSITEAIENDGVDAWEKFGEKGSSVLEDLGKQIAYSLFFSDKFKRLQADLEKIYGSGKTEEEIAKEARDLVSSFYQGIGTDMNNAQQWMEHWKEEANKQGFHLWETENREVSSNNGIAASQDSVNELNGRTTAIQGHTYSINEGIKSLVSHCAKFLEVLTGIRENTSYCKNLESINSNIKEMKESIGNMNDKGVIMRK